MKRNYIFLLLFLFSFMSGYAQQAAEKFFSVMPNSVLPIIDKTARLDMIDLYNSNMSAKAENVYGGQAEMLKKSDDFISIKCTESSSWQMKILPMGHDTLIVCIHSVTALDTSSKISAYKRDWHIIKRDMPNPTFEQFVNKNAKLPMYRIQQLMAEMRDLPIEISWVDDAPTLIFKLSKNSLPNDDKKDADALVHPITYNWVANKWMMQQ